MKRRIYLALRRTGMPADQAFKLASAHCAAYRRLLPEHQRSASAWRDFDARR